MRSMFARTITVRFKVDRVDEAIRIYEQNIVPIARSLEGYKGIYLLVDRETGNGISLSLWSEEEGAVAGKQGGRFAEEMPKLADVMTVPPVAESFECPVSYVR
ncbi:MAG: hypothetical protein KJ907_01395 [Actinobacteria bacterium]|nr:hypothetical protein [Actinomycetota bacterium]MBU4401378.1 hypothetical protein [Actinomycetota bacterium]